MFLSLIFSSAALHCWNVWRKTNHCTQQIVKSLFLLFRLIPASPMCSLPWEWGITTEASHACMCVTTWGSWCHSMHVGCSAAGAGWYISGHTLDMSNRWPRLVVFVPLCFFFCFFSPVCLLKESPSAISGTVDLTENLKFKSDGPHFYSLICLSNTVNIKMKNK